MTTNSILDILHQAPYGAYAVDMTQTIVFWSRNAERILGHKAEQVIGRLCYEVLQNLPGEGSTPICMESCPSILLARNGRVPPVVRVMARCASNERKQIVLTPLVVPELLGGKTLLVHLFHEAIDDERARRVANAVEGVISEHPATPPLGAGRDPHRGDASALTELELEVLRLVALGCETGEIVEELHLSAHTVRNHIRNARQKLQARNKLGAVTAAQRRGLF